MNRTRTMTFTKPQALKRAVGGAVFALAALMGTSAQAQTTIVMPANFASSGWAVDKSSGATAQISGAYPQSGNASFALTAPTYNDYATLFHVGGDSLIFSDLVTNSADQLGFDNYKSSASTVGSNAAPAFHLYVGQFSNQLVWEAAYNNVTPQTDSFQTFDIKNGQFWARVGGTNYNAASQTKTLAQWLSDGSITGTTASFNSSGQVVDYSVGVGSGLNGSYTGAVDNIQFGTRTTNFETPSAAPEPSVVAVWAFVGLGAAGLVLKAKKRKAAAV